MFACVIIAVVKGVKYEHRINHKKKRSIQMITQKELDELLARATRFENLDGIAIPPKVLKELMQQEEVK
jgi:hypothetical protein